MKFKTKIMTIHNQQRNINIKVHKLYEEIDNLFLELYEEIQKEDVNYQDFHTQYEALKTIVRYMNAYRGDIGQEQAIYYLRNYEDFLKVDCIRNNKETVKKFFEDRKEHTYRDRK